ncbi:hypothetical protein GCM10027566_38350 [Arachidicoccus ginsenosidivorans]
MLKGLDKAVVKAFVNGAVVVLAEGVFNAQRLEATLAACSWLREPKMTLIKRVRPAVTKQTTDRSRFTVRVSYARGCLNLLRKNISITQIVKQS